MLLPEKAWDRGSPPLSATPNLGAVKLQSKFFSFSVYFSKCYTKYKSLLYKSFPSMVFMIVKFYLVLDIFSSHLVKSRKTFCLIEGFFLPLKKWQNLQINIKCSLWSCSFFEVDIIESYFLDSILKLVFWKLHIKNSTKRDHVKRNFEENILDSHSFCWCWPNHFRNSCLSFSVQKG